MGEQLKCGCTRSHQSGFPSEDRLVLISSTADSDLYRCIEHNSYWLHSAERAWEYLGVPIDED